MFASVISASLEMLIRRGHPVSQVAAWMYSNNQNLHPHRISEFGRNQMGFQHTHHHRSFSLSFWGEGHTLWACRWHLCSPVEPVPLLWECRVLTTREVPLIVISCSSLSTIPWQKWLPTLCLDSFGNMAPGLLDFPFYYHVMLIIEVLSRSRSESAF